MKKVLFFLSFLCCTTGMFAQFSIGAKAGITISNFSNITSETDSDVGYKAGISAQYMFSKLGVESGIYVKQIGIADSEGMLLGKDNVGIPVSMEVQPKYVDIPISLIYKFPITENLRLTVNGGGYLAFGYGGGGIISYPDGSFGISAFDDINLTNTQDFNNFTAKGANKFDYGLTAGVGLDFLRINISVNYDLGLNNVYDQYPISPDSKDIKNRVFWVGIGYNIKL